MRNLKMTGHNIGKYVNYVSKIEYSLYVLINKTNLYLTN